MIDENNPLDENSSKNNFESSSEMIRKLMSIIESMHDKLKNREPSPTQWKNFIQKDGYIVAQANKIFEIISEMTKSCNNSDNKTKLSTKELHNSEFMPKKILPQYEEEKIPI